RRAKPSIAFDQGGDAGGGKDGHTVDERQMDADAERRDRCRPRNRLRRRWCVREQAGAGQDSMVMGVENPIVHTSGQPEIVRVDYKAPHDQLLGIRKTCAATAPPARSSAHGLRRARSWLTSSSFSNVACSSCTITQVSRPSDGMPAADNASTEMSRR